MKYGKLLLVLGSLLLLSGCGLRYQTYKLIEGEVEEGTSEESEGENHSAENEHEHEMEVTRYVLVDKVTGKIFYFNEMLGELNVCDPKGK